MYVLCLFVQINFYIVTIVIVIVLYAVAVWTDVLQQLFYDHNGWADENIL